MARLFQIRCLAALVLLGGCADNRQQPQLEGIKIDELAPAGSSNSETIEIVEEPFTRDVCNDFVPAELIPIRFSLLHVCKSIGKLIILLAKSGFSSIRKARSQKEQCR